MAEPAEAMEDVAEASPRRPMWSGTVSFGLVSIPVNLVPGVRHTHIALRMLGGQGTPLSRRYACAVEDKEIPPEHIVRGYEVAPDKFVVVEDEELEALAPEKSRDIDLRRFVKLDEIDPVFFDRPYYLTAGGGSTKAYRLLAETMEKTGRAGIATFVMRGKEYLIAIIAEGGLLRAETLRFVDELRSAAQVGLPKRKKAPKRELTRVDKGIRALAADAVDPADLVDERNRRLVALIARKEREGRDVVRSDEAAEPGDAVVIDLMDKLKRSLAGRKSPKRHGKHSRRAA
jgi:DNA end-binding protein Ku